MEPINPDFAKALVKAQSDMGAVIKNASNPAFKSRYADLATVVEAVLPPFNKAGIAVIQHADYDGEAVSVETMLVHEGGANMTHTLHLRPTKTDPQGVGSAITYGRRYALLAVAGVAPEDDDGNAASAPGEQGRRFTQAASNEAFSGAPNGIKRLSSAQAKERGLGDAIKADIDACKSEEDLDDWEAEFDRHTAQVPTVWLDAIRNHAILRREEIQGEAKNAALDREFAGVVG